MNINIWMTICLFLATASSVAVAVYLIFTLIQLKKTAKEMEETFSKINKDLEVFNKVSGTIAGITEKFSSPLLSVGAAVYYFFSAFTGKKKNGGKEEKNM